MSALTQEELDMLTVVTEGVRAHAMNPAAGALLADEMRRKLPDLDDVTIGRVLLAYGDDVSRIAVNHDDRTMARMSNQLLLAALDLTALERQGATDG